MFMHIHTSLHIVYTQTHKFTYSHSNIPTHHTHTFHHTYFVIPKSASRVTAHEPGLKTVLYMI